MKTLDYFAELYVAGVMANAGWNIYFPHRDKGMDFVASKTGPDGCEIIRPIQVKGKYPQRTKTDKAVYGYVGKLNQIHPQMILAIPYFGYASTESPLMTAYMPFSAVKRHSKGYCCQPAAYKDSMPVMRRDFREYFDESGLAATQLPDWGG